MRKLIAITLLLSSSIAMAETAQTVSEPWYERDRLSGNWAGERDSLEASGVAPFIVYDSILAANVSGGIKSDEGFTGQLYAGLNMDFEKILDLQGTTFKISVVNRHGNTISESVGGVYDPGRPT